MSDYYSTLGVSKNASPDEIKQAFRKLAHQYHPDKKGGDEKKFKEINEAYQVLSNKEKRAQYDQFGKTFAGDSEAGGFDFNSFRNATGGFDFANFGFEDLGDIFEQFGGFNFGQKQRRKNRSNGSSIQVILTLNLEDTLNTSEEKISLDKFVPCDRCEATGAEPGSKINECFACRGRGYVQQMKRLGPITFTQDTVCPECKGEGRKPEKPCNVCKGEGRIKNKEEIKIKIPAGVDNGQALKFPGMGNVGRRGEQAGDLLIMIKIKEHPMFERRGDDLITGVFAPYSAFVLGGKIKVPVLGEKEADLKVPVGSEIGKIFKLSGKGIPHFNGWGSGDLYVELLLDVPKRPTRKQKDIIKQMAKEGM